MNKIVLLGKLIRDPELKTIENGEKVFTRFIIAVDRNFKSADGTRKADLIPVTIWGRKAEVVCKYMTKGSYISLSSGSLISFPNNTILFILLHLLNISPLSITT